MWDDDDDDFDSEYTEVGFQDFAFNMRSLSNAIWTTGQHYFCDDVPSPVPPDPRRDHMMEIFRAFATLLTRNSRTQLVAVTGEGPPSLEPTRILGLVPTDPHPLGPSEDLGAWSVLSYEDIWPPDPESDATALPASFSPTRSVTDVRHANNVLHVISVVRGVAEAHKDRVLQQGLEYVVQQCWAEVTSRLSASSRLFAGPPFLSILRGWYPADGDYDHLPPIGNLRLLWIPIQNDGAAMRLLTGKVPARHKGPMQFLFAPSTVRGWLKALVDTLDSLFHCAFHTHDTEREPSDIHELAHNMSILSALLQSPAIVSIFHLPSLQSYFMSFPEQGHDRTALQDRLDYTIVDDERRNNEEPGEHVLRYLNSLTSWYTSIITLTDAYAHPKLSLPTLRLVFCSRPFPIHATSGKHRKMLSPRSTAENREVLNYLRCCYLYPDDEEEFHLIRSNHWAGVFDRLLPPNPRKYVNFYDATHTEALLMDFVAQACHEGQGRHFDVFTPCHQFTIIGIPVQHTMCYCCNFLESVLFDRERHDHLLAKALLHSPERFFLNSFPGHLQPWSPPRLFTNKGALEAVHGALCQIFANVVRTYYNDRTPPGTPLMDLRCEQ